MENQNTVKALPVYVYRCSRLEDCTNGGVSASSDRLLLICEDGFVDAKTDDPTLLRLVKREFGGGTYLHAEPVNPDRGEKVLGPMFGGNYVSTSDSRFPSDYPIPVHDRYETREQYDLLSR